MAKIRFKDMVNPLKWVSFVKGTIIAKVVTVSYVEQLMYRFLTCKPCMKAGACVDCGCNMPDKAMVAGETCSMGEWGPMMSEEEWKDHKEEYGIEFIVKFKS